MLIPNKIFNLNNDTHRLYTCAFYCLVITFIALAFSIFNGLMNDDYLFIRVFDLHYYGHGLQEQLIRTFAFFPSQKENIEAIAQGYSQANWWTRTDIEHWFFRPIAAFSHYMDYRFLNRHLVLMHIHSYIYLVLSLGLLVKLLDVLEIPLAQRTLIVALYFIDTSSLWSGWIAQRNSYMALSAMFATLIFHIRFMQTGSITAYLLSILFIGVSLLSSEAGIVTSVYLFFLPLALRQSLFSRKHLLQMIPYAIICLAFLLMYRHYHFGVSNHPFYTNPITEPLKAISTLGIKVPFFMLSGAGLVPAEASYLIPEIFNKTAGYILLAILNIMVISSIYYAWKTINTENRPLFTYGIICSFAALLPLTGSMVADRSATFLKVGTSIALGSLLFQMVSSNNPGKKTVLLIKSLPAIIIVKTLLIACASVFFAIYLSKPDPALAPFKSTENTPAHVVYLKAHDIFLTSYMLEKIQFNYDSKVKSAHRLVANNGPILLERIDMQTITLTAAENRLLLKRFDLPMEEPNFSTGQKFDAEIMKIEVMDAEHGLPKKLKVQFLISTDKIVFINYVNGGYKKIALPEPGQAISI